MAAVTLILPRRRSPEEIAIHFAFVQNVRVSPVCRARFWPAERRSRSFSSVEPCCGRCSKPHAWSCFRRALQHRSPQLADGLAGLPKDYAGIPRDVPRLGPPLPGDLGRPIVAAQASLDRSPSMRNNSARTRNARPRAPARSLHRRMCGHRRQRRLPKRPKCCAIVG